LLAFSFMLLILNIVYSSYVKYEHYKQASTIVKIKDLKTKNLELEAYITNKINYYSVKDFADGKDYKPVSWDNISFLNK